MPELVRRLVHQGPSPSIDGSSVAARTSSGALGPSGAPVLLVSRRVKLADEKSMPPGLGPRGVDCSEPRSDPTPPTTRSRDQAPHPRGMPGTAVRPDPTD